MILIFVFCKKKFFIYPSEPLEPSELSEPSEPKEPPELTGAHRSSPEPIGAVVVGSDEKGSGAPIPEQIIISTSVSLVILS